MSYDDVLFTYYILITCTPGIRGNICCQLIVDGEAHRVLVVFFRHPELFLLL